jgi:FtsP/CotA-like multicopper oxidase with cupredoxin domain
MSNTQRLLAIVAAVIVLVGGFVLLQPGDDDGDDSSTVATATNPIATTDAPAATTPAPAATTPAAEPEAQFTPIRVGGGKPEGGVKTIKAKKGDRVRIEVSSPDTTSEVHLHGYDIKRDLKAGGKVRFSFTADAEGIFEMELEDTAVQIAKIEIGPS